MAHGADGPDERPTDRRSANHGRVQRSQAGQAVSGFFANRRLFQRVCSTGLPQTGQRDLEQTVVTQIGDRCGLSPCPPRAGSCPPEPTRGRTGRGRYALPKARETLPAERQQAVAASRLRSSQCSRNLRSSCRRADRPIPLSSRGWDRWGSTMAASRRRGRRGRPS